MGTLPINFPKPGSKVTYREAIEAYDALVRQSIKLVYSEHFSPCAGAYDLLQAIEGAAEKYGVYDSEEIVALRRSLRGFSCERASLANGVNGERFHLMQDLEELDAFDRTHIFEVGVDGEKLLKDLEAALFIIREEAEQFDEYSDAYSRKPTVTYRVIRKRPRRERRRTRNFVFAMWNRGIADQPGFGLMALAFHRVSPGCRLFHCFLTQN